MSQSVERVWVGDPVWASMQIIWKKGKGKK